MSSKNFPVPVIKAHVNALILVEPKFENFFSSSWSHPASSLWLESLKCPTWTTTESSMTMNLTSSRWAPLWHIMAWFTLRTMWRDVPDLKKSSLKVTTFCFCVCVENMFQHPAGTTGPGGCKECGQEEHDGRSQGQRTNAQRFLPLPPYFLLYLFLLNYSDMTPKTCQVLTLLHWLDRCRFPLPTHSLHTARPAWDHLDCPEEVWLWRWPGAHTGISIPLVSSHQQRVSLEVHVIVRCSV